MPGRPSNKKRVARCHQLVLQPVATVAESWGQAYPERTSTNGAALVEIGEINFSYQYAGLVHLFFCNECKSGVCPKTVSEYMLIRVTKAVIKSACAVRCVPLVESHSITCSERSTANIGRMHLIAHANKTVARYTYQNCGSAVSCIIVF